MFLHQLKSWFKTTQLSTSCRLHKKRTQTLIVQSITMAGTEAVAALAAAAAAAAATAAAEDDPLLTYLDDEAKAKAPGTPAAIKDRAYVLSRVHQNKYYSHIWLLVKEGENPPDGRKGTLQNGQAFYCIRCESEHGLSNKNGSKPSTEQIKRHLVDKHGLYAAESSTATGTGADASSTINNDSNKKAKRACCAPTFVAYLLSHNDSYERNEACKNAFLAVPSRNDVSSTMDERQSQLQLFIKAELSNCESFHVTLNRIEITCSDKKKKAFTTIGVRFCTPDFRIVSFILEVEIGGIITADRIREALRHWELDDSKVASVVMDVLVDFFIPDGDAFEKITVQCVLGTLDHIIMPHFFTNFGEFMYAVSPDHIPCTVPVLFAELQRWAKSPSVPIDPLDMFTFEGLAKIMKPVWQLFNYVQHKGTDIGSIILACRSLNSVYEQMTLDDAPGSTDHQDQNVKARAIVLNQRLEAMLSHIRSNMKQIQVAADGSPFLYTIPLVPKTTSMHGLSDDEKSAVKVQLMKIHQTMKGKSSEECHQESEDYGDILAIYGEKDGGKFDYYEFYLMQTKRHSALQKCENPGKWWSCEGADFPEFRKLARTWLASSAVALINDRMPVPLLCMDSQGQYDENLAKVSLWLGVNQQKCSQCLLSKK